MAEPNERNIVVYERVSTDRQDLTRQADPQNSAWDDPISALRAGVGHTAWTVDDLDAAHARAVEAGGRSVWTPRDTPEPGLRIAFVADPDGNLVELLSSDEEAPPT